MDVDLFDFDLPEERIALRPARPRDAAKLLHVPADGRFADHIVRDLPDLLRPGDVLVLNDTRVIPARLRARRRAREAGGGSADVAVEIMLHKREAPDAWRAFLKPGKRVKAGDTLRCDGELTATCLEKGEGDALLRFDRSGPALDAAVAAAGETPLPPYIEGRRKTDAADADDYQTVFAAKDGSVAAPTASLHFTDALLAHIDERGVERVEVTLHVGAGTFLPVSVKDTKDHVMHGEWGEVSPAAAGAMARAKAEGRRIVSAGTTALRLIETAARGERIAPFVGDTDIFITPGFEFRAADLLLTNFHLPRSTLFMLVSAFSGLERMKAAYAHAVKNGYRFYSYGDASLLERAA